MRDHNCYELMSKALFLDRDGVINIDKVHVFEISQFEFTAGIFDLCMRYSEAGYLIIVITNQAGIAKGHYTELEFKMLTSWMIEEFEKRKIHIEKVLALNSHWRSVACQSKVAESVWAFSGFRSTSPT